MAKRRLGRGLDGMLPATPPKKAGKGTQGFSAPIEDVHPNREQPRTRFDDAALDELAASIRELGVLEPILVRERAQGGYEIVAGERRWRAAQRAGLKEVPVFVRELSTEAAFEAALVENLQREDLNPVETARAFERLIDEHGLTQETVAKRVGKDRSTIANALRLLKLPEAVLVLLEEGRLSEGHGRALLGASGAPSMKKLAQQALKKGWSVRETERRVRASSRDEASPEKPAGPSKSANVRDLEQRLTRSLGARVNVEDKSGKGKLVVSYSSYDELDRILEQLLSGG
ncbi:MAG TPA: ParB/RepB/Spo0J family partition protein [Sandaracinaceae bacterium LLY-WYZ-13_1]|nr:ParB/RepB/Spo0J family partition protein [Sandaracinaceae bacterium LLY-WYZ-13_1]